MKADTLVILDQHNATHWVRSATTPLAVAAEALFELTRQNVEAMELVRSYTEADGTEVLVEFLTEAAYAARQNPGVCFATLEIWHADPPRFCYAAGEPVARKDYKPVAYITLPERAQSPARDEELLNHAYARSRNVDRAWNIPKPCRSSSRGDVFVVRRGDTRQAYAVALCGFDAVQFD